MRLPIGIQDFQSLREDGYIYVDKTRFMQSIVAGGRFFLARPRRFGKSLILSTLKAAFEGRKELFKDLWLENNHDFKGKECSQTARFAQPKNANADLEQRLYRNGGCVTSGKHKGDW